MSISPHLPLVWDRDDDVALLVPLLDVAVGFGDLR